MLRLPPLLFCLLSLALVPLASPDVIYTYTGTPFDISGWDSATFGPSPTQVTAVVDMARPFPLSADRNLTNFRVEAHLLYGHSLSDGIRVFNSASGALYPSPVWLRNDGRSVLYRWGVILNAPASYDPSNGDLDRALTANNYLPFGGHHGRTENTDRVSVPCNGTPMCVAGAMVTDAGSTGGTWTAVVTPEVSTGAMGLILGSLLLFGYRTKKAQAAPDTQHLS